MANKTITGKITHTERMASSRNSNPRFMVTIMTEEGEAISHPTAVDSMLAFGIENREYREHDHEYVINGKGNIIYVNPYPAITY